MRMSHILKSNLFFFFSLPRTVRTRNKMKRLKLVLFVPGPCSQDSLFAMCVVLRPCLSENLGLQVSDDLVQV